MYIYSYDPTTKVYSGKLEADPDPLVPNNFLIPAYATVIAPPEYDLTTHFLVFNNVENKWDILPIETPTQEVIPDDVFIKSVRDTRNYLLSQCDYIVTRQQSQILLGVAPALTATQFNEWLVYMQQLRDFMNTFNIVNYSDKDFSKVIFPTPPTL